MKGNIMSIFDIFKGKKTCNDLRLKLINAAQSMDKVSFLNLCKDNLKQIEQEYLTWNNVPKEYRNDKEKLNWWVNSMVYIGEALEEIGFSGLLDLLMQRNSDKNILEDYQDSYLKAQQMYDDQKYEESILILRSLLDQIKGLKGSLVDNLKPRIFGLLGTNYYQIGVKDKAIDYTNLAIRECEETNDLEGVKIYKGNLCLIKNAFDN